MVAEDGSVWLSPRLTRTLVRAYKKAEAMAKNADMVCGVVSGHKTPFRFFGGDHTMPAPKLQNLLRCTDLNLYRWLRRIYELMHIAGLFQGTSVRRWALPFASLKTCPKQFVTPAPEQSDFDKSLSNKRFFKRNDLCVSPETMPTTIPAKGAGRVDRRLRRTYRGNHYNSAQLFV